MREGLRSLLSGWGRAYAADLLAGRLRAPILAPGEGPLHAIVVVANHFEPLSNGWTHAEARRGLAAFCASMEALGVKDGDGQPFKHTYFFPAEQYHPDFLVPLGDHCAKGFGEVEVHLHHGIDVPDTAAGLEATLLDFVGQLVGHGGLARDRVTGRTGYCFVHGNWALANSAGGALCGVDGEMEILARTGCYLDCTLPSAPDRSQVAVINRVYECGRPLGERAPHRVARPIEVGRAPARLPVLLQGPLLLDWSRRVGGLPLPRIENGDLTAEFPPSLHRFRLWTRAHVSVVGRPEWIFVKLHTHGLVARHTPTLVGDPTRRFLDDLLATEEAGRWRIHFATAREAANMILAAADGHGGDPHRFRDYRFTR